jgi:hypothetical protein
VGARRVNIENERRQIWWIYFVFVHKNRIMKLVAIFLRREGIREIDERSESNPNLR